jgi:peptidoglycan L-alanyl-D-glutamate endopeptidase CwlK
MNYKLSKRSIEHLKGVNPLLIAIVVDAIRDSPHDFGIPGTGGLRTAEEQNGLYKMGKSKADGYIRKSYHQTGNAFDIYGYVNGKATWDKKVLTEIADHIKKTAMNQYGVKITWGGDWTKFVDMPHFQI